MEKCKKCERSMAQGARFCSYCGTAAQEKKRADLFILWVMLMGSALILGIVWAIQNGG